MVLPGGPVHPARRLSHRIGESTGQAHEIATGATEQSAGLAGILQTMNDLNANSRQTLGAIERMETAADDVRRTVDRLLAITADWATR